MLSVARIRLVLAHDPTFYTGVGMCQGGEPDTGEFLCMNVCCSACENGAWSMACVLQRRIEYCLHLCYIVDQECIIKRGRRKSVLRLAPIHRQN